MSLISKIFFLAMILAAPGVSQGKVEGSGASRRFVSQKYMFSMAVPVDWAVSIALDTPVFFYAPPSGRFIQDSIPPGGAVITVESHNGVSGLDKSAKTPEEWARADARVMASGSPSIKPFQMPNESDASHAVISFYNETAYSQDQRVQHSVGIFWEYSHKLFAAHLNYNAKDRKGPAFEKIFFQTIRSFRPLAQH